MGMLWSSFYTSCSPERVWAPGVLPTMAFNREASPGRGTLIRLQAYERIGILRVQVYERAGNSVIRVISNILKRHTLTWPYRCNLLNGTHKEKSL